MKFLFVSLLAVFGGSHLPGVAMADEGATTCSGQQQQQQQHPPFLPTPSDHEGPFYLANSVRSVRIGPEALLNDPSKRLVVRGRVLSSRGGGSSSNPEVQTKQASTAGDDDDDDGCGGAATAAGVGNVNVEVWYAGEPNSAGRYYQDDEFRGQFQTQECGQYEYVQTFPELYPTRPMFHIHFRLSRGSEQLLITQMYFVGGEMGYVQDDDTSSRRKLQSSAVTVAPNGERSVNFDIYVDVEGDLACGGSAIPGFPGQGTALESSAPSWNHVGGMLLLGILSLAGFYAA